MKIGVTSQNFRTITGHAGKTRRFLVYEPGENGEAIETERLDLPKSMSMQSFRGTHHPIDDFDVLITGGCGQGFRNRMASRGVEVVTTSETDPVGAARAVIAGKPLSAEQAPPSSTIEFKVHTQR